MKILKVIRSAEWWEYKLPPLLAIGYATTIKSNGDLLEVRSHLLFLFFSLVIGAIYVSIINDITDIKIDRLSGKKNRMSNLSDFWHWILPISCISIGVACGKHMFPDKLSILMYSIPWISFSLYSFKPVRLKEKGIFGVLADASGSHIFTSLLMISSISFVLKHPLNWFWFIITGIWALCYGLRGILWHQFHDRKNDIRANVNTFAVHVFPAKFKLTQTMIFSIEVGSILAMLFYLNLLAPVLFLLAYLFLAIIRSAFLKYKAVIILSPSNEPYHILMADYYQVFFPIALIVTAAIENPYIWIMLILHFLLFPQKIMLIVRDLIAFIRLKDYY